VLNGFSQPTVLYDPGPRRLATPAKQVIVTQVKHRRVSTRHNPVVALSNVKVSASNFVRLMGCRDVDTDTDEEVIADKTKPITVQIPKLILTAAGVPLIIKPEKLKRSRKVVIVSWLYMLYHFHADISHRKIRVWRM